MQLFQKSNGSHANVINLVPALITADDNSMFNTSFTIKEFKHAAPMPGGFNLGFYQHFWDTCGHELYQEGCKWLANNVFPTHVKSINITLIPKGDTQVSMKD
jgi:hypothetical protein